MEKKIVLVTGAASGFGAMMARALARAGHQVYASMRDLSAHDGRPVAEVEAFAREHSVDLRAIELDVTSDDSAKAAIERIIAEVGRINVLIHNAGHMGYGPAEAFSPAQYAQFYEVNVIGAQRVNRAALPHMRTAGKSLMVWIGSSSTRGGTPPFLAPYFAAKAGMDALAQSYALELSRFGIETTIIVPGAFTKGTEHFNHAASPADAAITEAYFTGPYNGVGEQMLKRLAALEPEDSDPEKVAEAVVEVVAMPHGKRPFRVHVDPSDDGAVTVNAVADRVRAQFLERVGFTELLHPTH